MHMPEAFRGLCATAGEEGQDLYFPDVALPTVKIDALPSMTTGAAMTWSPRRRWPRSTAPKPRPQSLG